MVKEGRKLKVFNKMGTKSARKQRAFKKHTQAARLRQTKSKVSKRVYSTRKKRAEKKRNDRRPITQKKWTKYVEESRTQKKTLAAMRQFKNHDALDLPPLCPSCTKGKLYPVWGSESNGRPIGNCYMKCDYGPCRVYHNVSKFLRVLVTQTDLPLQVVADVMEEYMDGESNAPSLKSLAKRFGACGYTDGALSSLHKSFRVLEAGAWHDLRRTVKFNGETEVDSYLGPHGDLQRAPKGPLRL